MKRTLKVAKGGGATTNSSSLNKVFQPLIATSLALTLGVSVGNALTAGSGSTCTSSSGVLSICASNSNITTAPSGDKSKDLEITWQGVNSQTQAYIPSLNGGSIAIENLNFKFSDSAPSGGEVIGKGTSNGSTLNIDVKKSQSVVVLIKGNQKGLQIGSTGTGTMTIDFGIGSDSARDFTLDLSDTSAGNFSYKGNLVVKAGKGYLDTGSSTFNGYFKKAFIGNITLERTESGNASWAKNNLTFNSGIQGNISTKVGTNTITFNDGNLEGSISALTSGGSFANPINHITFEKKASITGNISAGSGPWDIGSQNNIEFKANGTIGSSSSLSTITAPGGNNTITFVEDGTIYANLQSTSTPYGSVGTNVINFQGTGTNTINGNITGNGANNTISFTGVNSTNTIVGNLSAGTTDRGGSGANTITAKNNSGESVNLTINGNILTDAGTNSITVENGTLTIKKANTASSDIVIKGHGGLAGKNTISAKTLEITVDKIEASRDKADGGHSSYQNSITATENNANSTLTANNGIVAKNSVSSQNSNTIDIKQGTLTIKEGGIEGSNGGNNTITAGVMNITGDVAVFGGYTNKNSLTLTGSSDSNISGKLSAVGQHSQNTLKIDGTGKLTISGGIEARSNGINSITLTNGSLETSSITTTSGSNTINSTTAGSVTLTGGIDNNAGTTSIITTGTGTFTLDNSNATISTYGGVTANTKIQSKGALTLTLKSLQVNSDGNSTNTNTIIAEAQGGNTIKITDGIQTNHGKGITNLAINGNSSNTTSSSLTANIINSGSTNIILQDTTWAPSALKKITTSQPDSGVLTNNSGVTNFVTRATGTISQNGSIPIYGVNALGGQTNIVMQGNASAVANINYGGGNATLIFASGSDSADDSFKSNATDISKNKVLGKTYENGIKLSLHDYNVAIQDNTKSLIGTFGDNFKNANGALVTLDVTRSSTKDTINIDGLIAGDISSLADSQNNNKQYEVELASESAFVGTIGIQSTNISLKMDANSKLVFAGGKSTAYAKLATLTINNASFDSTQTMNPIFDQTNTVINLATGVNDVYNAPNRTDFRLLEIGSSGNAQADTGLVGDNALFQVYVNANAGTNATLGGKTKDEWNTTNYGAQYGADRIIVHNAGNNSTVSNHHLQIVYDAQTKIDNIKYTSGGTEVASNIAVATVVNKANGTSGTSGQASTNGVVNFALQNTLQGFDEIVSTLVGVYTDEYGKTSNNGNANTYTTYFVNNARSAGASEANREATATAFGVNYDLYMANFNSLNKRMGELRDNPHSQGAWIRIFNGSQTNDMGLGTKSNYTTFQGGYDYAFGMEGANNYLGLAIAYGLSDSKIQSSMADLNGSQRGVENIKSNAVEVAVYNSYVQDEGWYNDTIAKFSYIFSDFNMMGQSQTYSTSNMAFTLSDEFGYRFKLGENKEWTIDPQLEVAYGYFDQSDFVQKLGVATLDSTLESITTLRTRVGSSFGYNFKNFTANKPIKASVYLGTFYEFDYISGGDITMTTNLGSTNSINSLSPDGRVVMNVGTNVEIYDNTRIYFDFESSFAGKIRTDYQVNIGARYSFGESNGYTPISAIKTKIAPLKVSDEKPQEQPSQENTSSEEKTDTNKTEQKAQ